MLRARTLPSIIIPLFAGSANSNRCPNNNNNYYNNQYLNNVGQECGKLFSIKLIHCFDSSKKLFIRHMILKDLILCYI